MLKLYYTEYVLLCITNALYVLIGRTIYTHYFNTAYNNKNEIINNINKYKINGKNSLFQNGFLKYNIL